MTWAVEDRVKAAKSIRKELSNIDGQARLFRLQLDNFCLFLLQ
jgi:hypothetical protein